ncbi:hypothetical protein B0H14DRAFT_3120256 [Mycena olivaceomarginata]|nr:hypothetical protein B0H14DRAFT_3120256 [Mycena olivaceomarginata]
MHKPSIHPVAHQSGGLTSNQSNQDGNARLRNRGTSSGVTQTVRRHSGIGSEPGINPRENDKYSHFSEKSPGTNPDANGAPAKRSLRWINIAGISWDVLSALALRYDLHTLALEDVLHEQGHNQSKADYYPQHLFLRVLCHSIPPRMTSTLGLTPGLSILVLGNKPGRIEVIPKNGGDIWTTSSTNLKTAGFQPLKKGDRVAVKHEPMFIFLLREGTVISIRPTPNLEFTDPVTERINQHDSVIRTSEDPAILIDTRVVHILSGDLIMHKRTLEPIKTMLYGLRRYDQDRSSRRQVHADINASDAGLGVGVGASGHHFGRDGYLSYNSKIYLVYVYDHIDFVLTSLDMFSGISENLINYAFNMASYEMNLVMRRLTLATIIFLPLTLLTGYFGMNFTSMWSVNDHSDLLFWIIALPVMGVIIPMFLYQDIKSMVHYIHKVMAARRAVLAQERGPW